MKKPLLLISILISVTNVFAQSHVTLLTDTGGVLVAPTNFFAANSNLLNQAVPTSSSAGGNYDPLYFGTNPAVQITLTNNLTNWQKLPTNILGTAAQSPATAFIAAHSGQGSNNILWGPTTTNATNIGPFTTDTNAIFTDGLGHLSILRNPLDTDGTKAQLDVSSGLFRVFTEYGTYAKQTTNQELGVPYAALTLTGESNGMGGILYMSQAPTTNIGASQDPITYLNQGAGSLLFSLGGVMQCDGSFQGAGGFWHSITNVTGNYQMGILDSIASVDASGGNVRIYLPPITNQPVSTHSNWFIVQDGWEAGPSNYTRTFTVVRTDNSANTVNILTTNHDVLNASGITNYILGPMRSIILAETWSNGVATICPIFDGSGFPSTNANDPNFLPNYFAAGSGISLSTTGSKTTITATAGGAPTFNSAEFFSDGAKTNLATNQTFATVTATSGITTASENNSGTLNVSGTASVNNLISSNAVTITSPVTASNQVFNILGQETVTWLTNQTTSSSAVAGPYTNNSMAGGVVGIITLDTEAWGFRPPSAGSTVGNYTHEIASFNGTNGLLTAIGTPQALTGQATGGGGTITYTTNATGNIWFTITPPTASAMNWLYKVRVVHYP